MLTAGGIGRCTAGPLVEQKGFTREWDGLKGKWAVESLLLPSREQGISSWDTIPGTCNLKAERFALAHIFIYFMFGLLQGRRCGGWPDGGKLLISWQPGSRAAMPQ